jgi:hypothetical protein
MTPPDSGEHRAWCSGGRTDTHGTRLGCDCKPASGEREVERCRWWHAVRGQCMLLRGHEGLHASPSAEATVSLPLPLAQRILAALEQCDQFWSGFDGRALASELRAAVERKP